jgi:hypothetical protein
MAIFTLLEGSRTGIRNFFESGCILIPVLEIPGGPETRSSLIDLMFNGAEHNVFGAIDCFNSL